MLEIMQPGNPVKAPLAPYIVVVAVAAILGAVLLAILRPDAMNTIGYVTMILAFAGTVMSTLSTMIGRETRELVNSRMDEFKATMRMAADTAMAEALARGKQEGRDSANERTDALAARTERGSRKDGV